MSDEVKSTLKVLAALSKAQQEFEPIKREAENPFFKKDGKASKYATLRSVITTVRPTLETNGLMIAQKNILRDNLFGVATRLVHLESGEELTSEFLAPLDKQTAQAVAAILTYGRRCEYLTILGLTPEDDDGNAASGNHSNPQTGQAAPYNKGKAKPKQAVKPATEAQKAPPALSEPSTIPEAPAQAETAPTAPETPKESNVTNLPTKDELKGFYDRAKSVSASLGNAGLAEPGPKLVKFITTVAGVTAMPGIDKTKFEAILAKLEEASKNHPAGLIQTIEERIK